MTAGKAQLEIVGKGSKTRQVLIPAVIAARLFAVAMRRRPRQCFNPFGGLAVR